MFVTSKILIVFLPCLQSVEQSHYVFLSAASSALQVRWFAGGASDRGAGVVTTRVDTGSESVPGYADISTYMGHAFKFYNGEEPVSDLFTYQGGHFNVVAVRDGPSSVTGAKLELEILGPKELWGLMVDLYRKCSQDLHCIKGVARTPNFGIVLPESLIPDLMKEWSPANKVPQVLHGPFGNTLEEANELVVISSLETPLEIQWMWSLADGGPPMMSFANESQVIATIPATAYLHQPAFLRLRASKGQAFIVSTPREGGATVRNSTVFTYSGELHVAVVSNSVASEQSLTVENFDEDELKVFLSDVAMNCSNAPDQLRCIEDAKAPTSGTFLPPSLSRAWFRLLWVSTEHWRLCVYQEGTPAIGSVVLWSALSQFKADVLREDPLVLVVPHFATAEECQELTSLAGDGSKIDKAVVSGGSHSRARRTNAKRLDPDFSNSSNPITKMSTRFFEVTRNATGFEVYPDGNEPINWLYYQPGYEYRPHCDGGCGQHEVLLGDRVASSLLYCAVADAGGATVFTKDNLKILPTPGMLLLFAYNGDPDRVTEHAACPVLRGVKTTATQWYREGVTAEESWEKVNEGIRPKRRGRASLDFLEKIAKPDL